jgi:hypothetical protein
MIFAGKRLGFDKLKRAERFNRDLVPEGGVVDTTLLLKLKKALSVTL